jgi:hypothetical protein
MSLRVSLFLVLAAVFALPAVAQSTVSWSAYTVGNDVYVTISGLYPGNQCCVGAAMDHPAGGASCGQPCRNTTRTVGPLSCNWSGGHYVWVTWADDKSNGYVDAYQPISVGTPPAQACSINNKINFDIIEGAGDRRVLLSNLNTNLFGTPNYPWPFYQQFLSRPREIPVNMRTIVDGAATPGVSVDLRIVDPADKARYIAGGPGIVQPVPGGRVNDNMGTVMPKLKGTGLTDNGNGTYTIVSGSEGYITTEMEVDPTTKAGDNWQVVATMTLPDGSGTKTDTSGTITAWKRMFVEKKQMFRRGAPLATLAPAGIRRVIIPNGPIANTEPNSFERNDYVLLLHAPGFGQPKAGSSAFYRNLYQIATGPRGFRARAPQNGRGTIDTNGTATLVGNGTRFSALDPGDVINVGGESRVVLRVLSNTAVEVHAPILTSIANQAYTVGDMNLVPGRRYVELTLDRDLTETYSPEPLINPATGPHTLNDAVVRLAAGGLTAADFFDASDSRLTGTAESSTFPAASTEYVVLPPQFATAPNLVQPVPRMLVDADAMGQRFIDKWFTLTTPQPLPGTDPFSMWKYVTPPNHQLVLVGDRESGDILNTGRNGVLVRSLPGEMASLLYRGTMEYKVGQDSSPQYNADVDTTISRTLVHELVHQWHPNDGYFTNLLDHCYPTVAYTSTAAYPSASSTDVLSSMPAGVQFCLMSSQSSAFSIHAPWKANIDINAVEYSYRTGLTDMHIIQRGTSWHSEYLEIRKFTEPWMPW